MSKHSQICRHQADKALNERGVFSKLSWDAGVGAISSGVLWKSVDVAND
jgi:hypothetical protein